MNFLCPVEKNEQHLLRREATRSGDFSEKVVATAGHAGSGQVVGRCARPAGRFVLNRFAAAATAGVGITLVSVGPAPRP